MTESRYFGNSGLKVSPMCLGTMMFGGPTPLVDAQTIADMALEHGVFFWDTADMYGKGASEEVVGRLMKGKRNQIVLATKVFAQMSELPNDRGLSARHIIRACEQSLKRLQTEWIDVYYLHFPDAAPIEESLRAVEDLCRSGKVRYVACSNYRAWETLRLIQTAKDNGWQPLVGIQPLYNIVNRDIEVELLPMAQHYGLGVASYSPLARGVLTGKYSKGNIPEKSRLDRKDKRFIQAEWREESVWVAEQLLPLANRLKASRAQVATRWAMANSCIHSVIIGPRTVEQAKEALLSQYISWDKQAEEFIDTLIPPGCHSGKGFFDQNYAPVLGRKPVFI